MRVPKDTGASWFETAPARLLTVRNPGLLK